ncbi:MAG TPA: glucose-6-phosphate dehydrogenase [Candidatus Limnocylindrales bacterium]|jgi:glucose-6-phosphate 1-dehydrogenase
MATTAPAPTIPAPTSASVNPLRQGLRQERMPEPCTMVICGATGDLTRRKLAPAIYNLALGGFLPPEFTMVGFARRAMTDEEFHAHLREGIEEFSRNQPMSEAVWSSFASRIEYQQGDVDDPQAWAALARRLERIDRDRGTAGNRVFYLAIQPSLVPAAVNDLGGAGLAGTSERTSGRQGWTRVVVEKPFGSDVASAETLNRQLRDVFTEEQIYRIDHYLGKETVQNLAVFRFGNGLFEPIWNRRYIDSVQITVAETVGLEGRGEFYDQTGALRDIVQNHVLQLLAVFAMEPPVEFAPNDLRDEKLKVLRAVRPMSPEDVAANTVRGQYITGWVAGEKVPAYRDEPEVAPDSDTETYVALRLGIDSWRWAGVPFYIRTGKALPSRVTEIAVQFRRAPLALFGRAGAPEMDPNVLAIRIQPDEGILLRFGAKVPGPGLNIRSVNMDFRYGSSFAVDSPDAYETLLLDCMVGDSTLFTRDDEVVRAWEILDPIVDAWHTGTVPLHFYAAGSWGPPAADELLARDAREWRRP